MAYNTPYRTQVLRAPQPVLTPLQRVQRMTPAQKALFGQYITGLQAQQNPQTPLPGAPGTQFVLPGGAEAEFLGQRQNVNEQYMENLANTNFAAANAGIQHARDVADQRTQWIQARSNFDDQYGARGMLGSGDRNLALTNATAGYNTAVNRTAVDYARQRAGFNLQRTQYENRRAIALGNLRTKHAAVLGDAAARSVR